MNAAQGSDISSVVFSLRQHFNAGVTRTLAFRQQQLAGLKRFLIECESDILAALHEDLGKPRAETLSAEIGLLNAELAHTNKHLAAWMKPKRVSTSFIAMPGRSMIYPQPLGVVLVIAPWNYPLQLTLAPLIGALAAGNCAVVKPSEVAAATSRLLATKLPGYIDSRCLKVIEGGIPETTALLQEQFDYIFYTGNGTVGRVVMTAAAKHLTPLTMELGGKSPCIVNSDTDLDVAARRIVWGKFSNAGQTCVAPDYVLVHEAVEEQLLAKLRIETLAFYGNNPEMSADYGRIINHHHYQRLMQLIPGSGTLYEIFGPILPVLKIKDMQAAINFVNAGPKPLALYIFTSDSVVREKIIAETSSGSVSINYPMLQLTVPALPFGGVGASGMGAYHGQASFATFTHYKSVLVKPTWFDPSLLYPPYSQRYTKLCRWLMG
jgi:aldehyde dehydrogenase (NAD+)